RAGTVRWQRDGKALLFNHADRVYRVSLDGGPPELVAERAISAEDCGGGRLVLQYSRFEQDRSHPVLVLREADHTEHDLLSLAPGICPWNVRCDREGRRMLYSTTETPLFGPSEALDLWLLDLTERTPRRLTTDHAGYVGTFTPDGQSLIVAAT